MRSIIILCFVLISSDVFAQLDSTVVNRYYKYAEQGDTLKAKSFLDSLFSIAPDNTYLNNAFGVFFQDQNQLDTAIVHFERSYSEDSTYIAPLLNLAFCCAQKEEYITTLEYAQQYCKQKKSVDAFRLMADTYSILEMFDSAMVFYERAIEVDSTEAALYYNLSQIYWYQYTHQPLAYEYISKGIALDSTQGYFYSLRAQVLLDDYPLEALTDLNKGITLGDTTEQNYVYRSWAYVMLGEFEAAQKDLVRFQDKREYVYWKALIKSEITYQKGDYDSCIKFCNEALAVYPEDVSILTRKTEAYIYSRQIDLAEEMLEQYIASNASPPFQLLTLQAYVNLLQKTSRKKIRQNSTGFYLKSFVAKRYKYINKLSNKKAWSYRVLLKRFEEDYQSLDLSEYFMLYFGYSTTDEYSAFELTEMQEQTLYEAIQEGQYQDCIDVGIETLKKNPTQFPLYLPIAKAAYLSGDMNLAKKYAYISEAFYRSVLATGNGKSKDDALIVISSSHEYALLKYLGLSAGGQSLLNEEKHSYDKLITYDKAKRQGELFFLIDKVFESYGKMLKDK